jgi:CDP-glycerol glycerophosphotransferase (TagB/SpsB family)
MVITCRQAAYRFPEEKVLKFGFRHGPYHFKPFANIDSYNMNTEFFMTSTQEVKEAEEAGIICATAIGYPKLDYAFDGTFDDTYLNSLKSRIGLSSTKKTIIFTATWDKSGVSGISKWYQRLNEFTELYNVLVTVHPSTSEKYIEQIKQTEGVFFIEDKNAVPYIMISDVCIGDTSSILAECSALKKSIITFNLPDGKRTVKTTMDIIKSISYRVDNVDELDAAIIYALSHPNEKNQEMDIANKTMFDSLDGLAGKRAADIILKYLQDLNA